jgi:5-methylcytosine-specific restriction endonuclease McrA
MNNQTELINCSICLKLKDIEDFRRTGNKVDSEGNPYRYKFCKSCHNKKRKIQPGQVSIQMRWEDKNKDKLSSYVQRSSRKHPDTKRRRLLKKYGLTLQEYQEAFFHQLGCCAICSNPEGSISLAVDHCHKTGKVRGLLCSKCNTSLGMFGDCLESLQQANAPDSFLRYLQPEVCP